MTAVDVAGLRLVQRAALIVLRDSDGQPCDDLGCLSVVYMAGVADALAWAAGEGPLPRNFRERVT